MIINFNGDERPVTRPRHLSDVDLAVELAAFWVHRLVSPEQIVIEATELLERFPNSDSLAVLAGLDLSGEVIRADEVDAVLRTAFAEIGIHVPNVREAGLIVARAIASRIVAGFDPDERTTGMAGALQSDVPELDEVTEDFLMLMGEWWGGSGTPSQIANSQEALREDIGVAARRLLERPSSG